MIVSKGSGMALDKTQQSMQVNILCKTGLEENHLKMININNNKITTHDTKQQKAIVIPIKMRKKLYMFIIPIIISLYFTDSG